MQFHRINNLFHRVHRAHKNEKKIENKEMKTLHRGQGRVLELLNKEGELSIAQLVELLDVRPSSAGELVQKLEQSGYVERAVSEDDRRVSIISLTPEGKAILEQTSDERSSHFEKLFSGLSESEQEQLSDLLDKLIVSLKAMREDQGVELDEPRGRCRAHHGHRHGHNKFHHHGMRGCAEYREV